MTRLCNWSDDDYQCDIQISEQHDGWLTEVAATRPDWGSRGPPRPSPYDPDRWSMWNNDRWQVAVKKYHQRLRLCVQRKLTHMPCAGRAFFDEDAENVLERVIELERIGFQVPEWVHDVIISEIIE